MQATAATISARLRELEKLHAAADTETEQILTLLEHVDARDREACALILPVAEAIGRSGQAREGALVRALAQAHRVKAARGGLAPWITTHLDVVDGRGRAIAQSAREIGHLPHLALHLCSGRIGASTIRTLTRVACAIKGTDLDLTAALTETLHLATAIGTREANRHVQILEETLDPGRTERLLAKQRRRSFLRFADRETGMTRLEVLLDDERATTVKTAIDQSVAAIVRAGQYDGTKIAPEDLASIEQMQAHALTHLAEVYLRAGSAQRSAQIFGRGGRRVVRGGKPPAGRRSFRRAAGSG